MAFDSSSTLLATRLDESPSTLWIWDVNVPELRAVLIFHAAVSSATWHPKMPETLLVSCDGPQHRGLAFIWDRLSSGPRSVDFAQQCPGSTVVGKPQYRWLNADSQSPTLFFSDDLSCLLATAGGSENEAPPWGAWHDSNGNESPLELVPAATAHDGFRGEADCDDDSDELDDTFYFKTEHGS